MTHYTPRAWQLRALLDGAVSTLVPQPIARVEVHHTNIDRMAKEDAA